MVNILLIIFIIILLISVFPKNKKFVPFLFVFLGLILFFIAGYREAGVDRDYKNYIVLYNGITTDLGIEISFLIISNIVKYLFKNVIYLFIIYALLGVYIKLNGIKTLTPFLLFSLLLYFSNFFLLHEMTQIRVGISAGLLLIGIKYIVERNIKYFLFFSAFAIFFHYSAIIILPLWFLNNKLQKIFYYLVPIGILMYLLNINLIFNIPIPYIQNKLIVYNEVLKSGEEVEINVFNILFILRCFFFYLLLYYYQKISFHNRYFTVLLKIYGISLFVFPAFASLSVLSFRINELYGIVEIILIPFMIYVKKEIGILIVILYAIILFCYNIFVAQLIL